MTFNQRFTKAVQYLLNEDIISKEKVIMEKMSWVRARLSYLKGEKSKKLDQEEFEKLKHFYPQINWQWVQSELGNMIQDASSMAQKTDIAYGTKEWKKAELNKIISGKSILPKDEQLDLAIEEVLHLRGRIDKIMEINNESMMTSIKELFKKKK